MELNDPALTFTVALAAGIAAQAVAQHLRVPGIVLLLVAGALLGPDALGLIHPDTLGDALHLIVGLSVAVILFEGGLNLNIGRLRREASVIQRLITIGALVTGMGGAVLVRALLGWSWSVSILFGTLVIVTGPTVITPLLRRVRVRRNVGTILEAEGVLIDPVGAIVAVVALELVLAETAGGAAWELLGLPSRLVLGAAAGVIGGILIAAILHYEDVIPEGLENVFTLSLLLVVFEASNAIQAESGIMAAPTAGFVVANMSSHVPRELREFKEQLTLLFVGLLFVLLAADVRLQEVLDLGWAGVAVVALLMFVVRPLDVLASTLPSRLDWRERAFIAWIGPRGIVAAAIASIFADRLEQAGLEGGVELRALVFLVIAVTVVVQGLTSGPVASLLGVRRPSNQGYAIIGANALAGALGRALATTGEDVALIDTNPIEASAAEAQGLRVVFGNANEETVLRRADVEGRRGVIALTPNEGVNLLLARRMKEEYKVPQAYAALQLGKSGVTAERAEEERTRLLFGRAVDLGDWSHALRHGEAEVQTWRFEGEGPSALGETESAGLLPLALVRGSIATPVSTDTRVRQGDQVTFAVQVMGGAVTPRSLGVGDWSLVTSPDMKHAEETLPD